MNQKNNIKDIDHKESLNETNSLSGSSQRRGGMSWYTCHNLQSSVSGFNGIVSDSKSEL